MPRSPVPSTWPALEPVKNCNSWAGFPAHTPGWHTLLEWAEPAAWQRVSLPSWARSPVPPEPPQVAKARRDLAL